MRGDPSLAPRPPVPSPLGICRDFDQARLAGLVEPRLALTSTSSTGDGVLGAGFSLAGLSAITRCPSNVAQDGDIRDVRYDADDKLCLDGASM